MKLYKFRPLEDCRSLQRVEDILSRGEFWCSRFFNMNDPMESVFLFMKDDLSSQELNQIFADKFGYSICSFSGAEALGNPIMWGYYANGFKGVAIEIEVELGTSSQDGEVWPVRYMKELALLRRGSPNPSGPHEWVKQVLTAKLDSWAHEDEFRYMIESCGGDGNRGIGKIIGIYFGFPYRIGQNADLVIANSTPLKGYTYHASKLYQEARNKGIRCFSATFDGREVGIMPLNGDQLIWTMPESDSSASLQEASHE